MAGAGDLGEQALVERARRDADAFAELYRRYLRRVHAFAFRRTGSREAAEDITAATFERALRHLDRFQWRPGGFGPWLFRIAANEIATHHRREYRARAPRAQAALRALHPGIAHAETDAVDDRLDRPHAPLLDALDTLPQRYQAVIALRFFAELSTEQAAAAMDCSKPALSVLLHRALRALRRALGDDPATTRTQETAVGTARRDPGGLR